MRCGLLFFLYLVFLSTDFAHAAGMIMRIQQMKAQRNHQAQQEYGQEYQQYNQENEEQSQPAAPPTYQQVIDQRNQALAQAIVSAHSQAVSVEGTGNTLPASGSAQSVSVTTPSSDSQEVVDLSEVWKKLDHKSTVWNILSESQAKVLTVSEYINRFQAEGVKISLPPTQYVEMIDQMSQQNPQMLERPFGELLQILAIINYDFDNGMDKDLLAKKVLGEEAYEANKKRFSQQGQQQGN